jgi:5-methylthioadenosine/S-adenosylhomocysteine deaminase
MIRSGTSCFVDIGSDFPISVAAAAAKSGLRAFAAPSCADIDDTFFGPVPATLAKRCGTVIEKASDSILAIRALQEPRVNPALSVPWMAACSDELLEKAALLAEQRSALLVVGAGVSRDDAVASRREHFMTEIERLRRRGSTALKPIVLGGGWISPADMATLKAWDASIACMPSSSHRLGTGSLEYGRYAELLAFGVNVAFGTGSAMASNHTDIVRQLFLFCGANMSIRLDATVTPPETAVEMATIRAAKAVGLEHEIGSLEVGKKADISLFPTMRTDWIPLINPLENLAFSTRGGADTLIVDGQVLMSEGVVLSIDEAETLRECQSRASSLAARTGLAKKSEPAWPVI